MTKKIFISYAKKDARDIALALADALAEVDGLDVWIDRSLRAGRSWELQIQQQIDDCDVMIVLYSPDINRHKLGQPESYVLTEIAYAKYTAKKPIIPVMAIQTDAPISLTMEHYIDFTISGVISKLVEALCSELEIASDVELSELEKSAEAIRTIIGEPFEWCEVPAGEFVFGGDLRWHAEKLAYPLPAYAMSRYPITFGQYEKFVEDKQGYYDGRWWQMWDLSIGRDLVIQTVPKLLYPRTNIRWFDAIIFCMWLSMRLGGKYEIDQLDEWLVRLPSEMEWEKGARGTDGRSYPWGSKFHSGNCNTNESGIGTVTPVNQYPQGASPYGILDMSGNVWEWTLEPYDIPKKDSSISLLDETMRVVRGGAYDKNSNLARTEYRGILTPNMQGDTFGFRIMRPL